MLWAQWTLVVVWLAGLGINIYGSAAKGGGTAKAIEQWVAAMLVLALYYFAGAFNRIL